MRLGEPSCPYTRITPQRPTESHLDDYPQSDERSGLGLITPVEAEQAHYAGLIPQEPPVRARHNSRGGSTAVAQRLGE
jgi:hypothetical protein